MFIFIKRKRNRVWHRVAATDYRSGNFIGINIRGYFVTNTHIGVLALGSLFW